MSQKHRSMSIDIQLHFWKLINKFVTLEGRSVKVCNKKLLKCCEKDHQGFDYMEVCCLMNLYAYYILDWTIVGQQTGVSFQI